MASNRTAATPPTPLLNRAGVWPVRLLWLLAPVLAGPTYSQALDGQIQSFERGVSIALWAVWGVTLVATLLPRTVTLTLVRVVLPAAVPAVAWAAAVAGADVLTLVAIAVAVLTGFAALLPTTADVFVNGSSYGDERRMTLRPPGALVVGPIPLAWAATVIGLSTGPLLLLAQVWVAGAVLLAVGLPTALFSLRALHGLAQRWAVFVPAGMVLHDALAVVDPILFARRTITFLGPAPQDTAARDLTVGALGLALEIRVQPPLPVTFAKLAKGQTPSGSGAESASEAGTVDAILFTPSQPGELLREAARRGVVVG